MSVPTSTGEATPSYDGRHVDREFVDPVAAPSQLTARGCVPPALGGGSGGTPQVVQLNDRSLAFIAGSEVDRRFPLAPLDPGHTDRLGETLQGDLARL
jgi:hypothetical protein